MTNHPPRQKLVVAGVKLILPQPIVVSETVEEFRVLQNDGAVRSRASGETRQAAVDVRRGGDLNVSDGQSECG